LRSLVALGADTFMMLTDVEYGFRDFGEKHATPVGEVNLAEAKVSAAEGHFLAASMGPRMASEVRCVEDDGARAIISSPDKAVDALRGKPGTRVVTGSPGTTCRALREPHAVSLRQAVLIS
jgi:carbamate kinase